MQYMGKREMWKTELWSYKSENCKLNTFMGGDSRVIPQTFLNLHYEYAVCPFQINNFFHIIFSCKAGMTALILRITHPRNWAEKWATICSLTFNIYQVPPGIQRTLINWFHRSHQEAPEFSPFLRAWTCMWLYWWHTSYTKISSHAELFRMECVFCYTTFVQWKVRKLRDVMEHLPSGTQN